MRSTILSVMALGLSALAEAGFSSPSSGDKWTKGQSQMISWDKSSLSSGNCDIHLVPAGAKDASVIITEIALQVSNSGSYSWMPSSSISVAEAEILIVDSKMATIISSVVTFISESSGSDDSDKSGSKYTKSKSSESKKKYTMNLYTHESHTKTYETKGHETKTYSQAAETTSFLTVAVNGSYYTDSTSLTTVQVTTTVAGELTTYAAATTVPPPETTTSTEASAGAVYTMASNGTLALNATPTASTFTGAAPGSTSAFYSAAMGCIVGLAMVLLL